MAKSCRLNTGSLMPIISVGTFKLRGADVYKCVEAALETGYRSIDTASVYRNETIMGQALQELLPKYSLGRGDIFITSKLGPKEHGASCREAALKSLKNLGTDNLDLYLIHWPGVQGLKSNDINTREIRKESWRHMEHLHKEGKLKAIGVSNYTLAHMEDLLSYCTVKPAVLQIECHPHLQQIELRELCNKHGIQFQAYSSLGTMSTEKPLLNDQTICKIAEECRKSPAQVLLRWAVQQNLGIIPKSTNAAHIKENISLWDFDLSKYQMEQIASRNSDTHYCWNPENVV